MKISVLVPTNEFTPSQIKRLRSLGQVKFIPRRREMSLVQLEKFCRDCQILAADPDTLGGFDKAKLKLTELVLKLPKLKGVAVPTSYTGWIDNKYFNQRQIPVSFVPGYATESVAEHTLALMLSLAKKTFQTEMMLGTELAGKTLGIIGLGKIGSRTAELALGIGMKVIACNRTPKKQAGVKIVTLTQLLKQADVISLHVTDCVGNYRLIGRAEIGLMRPGAMVVNTIGNAKMVDERSMAKALKFGKIAGYAFEADDLEHTPLKNLKNAVGLHNFAWYTRESLVRLADIWIDDIAGLAKGKPQSVVNYVTLFDARAV